MSKICATCGKTPAIGNNVSHSHRHTKRRFDPNLQRVRVQTPSGVQRMFVCTACIRGRRIAKG